ncbi:MAG: LacI family DNA-binding transcriptional regulator [Roseburia sp.]|nr:LacI family DNA-binding transcriptional regulator [Roseburia sp.]
MKEKVTIYTLAEELNMTPAMVSRALNPNGKVSVENRQRVLQTAEKYNFVPNRHASRLSMRSIRIGVLIHIKFKITGEKMLKGIEAAYDNLKDYKIVYDVTVVSRDTKNAWECTSELNKYVDYDGVLISGFSSEKCIPMLNDFAKKNPNIVQFQDINNDIEYLFASRHDETLASNMAAEFLSICLRYKSTKNVLLFTGRQESFVHRNSGKAFLKAAAVYGLNVLECVDMQDSSQVLYECLPQIFEKYGNNIDGIYITSGVSAELCKYIERNGLNLSLVTFDVYDELSEYIEKGIISATISQNISMQAQKAFEMFARYVIDGEKVEKTVSTRVQLVMKSNLYLYRKK